MSAETDAQFLAVVEKTALSATVISTLRAWPRPLTTRDIASALDRPLDDVNTLLQDLQANALIEGRMMSTSDPVYGMEWRRVTT